MLTLLINESNPLEGLFANSTTGGVGTVPDITVADDGQAVSVQSFTRAGGIITDSFVAGDALHIGIGDGVNAPVCYVALSSASPAVGTMPINTAGMVALFAATAANQLSLTLAVVRTRGAYTNTIFSAPIVIRRSAINISTAVPTPSILGTGVSAALQVAINTALGFVRLDASARLPAVDGSQLTNVPNELPSQTGNSGKYLTTNGTATSWGTVSTGLTVGTTAIASGTTTRVLYDNAGVLGEYAISGTGSVAMTTSPAFTTPALDTPSALVGTNITGTATGLTAGNATLAATVTVANEAADTTCFPLFVTAATGSLAAKSNTGLTFNSSTGLLSATSFAGAFNGTVGATTPSTVAGTTGTFSGELITTGVNAQIYTNGADAQIYTGGSSAYIYTTGADAQIYTSGAAAHIYTNGENAEIYTNGSSAHIYTIGENAYIETGSTFKLNGGTYTTTLSHAATADRAIAFPDAAGTLLLSNGSGANLTGTAASLTAGTVTTNANLTGHVTSVGNAAVLGSFTFAQLNTAVSDANLARTDAANTFTGVQSMTSPDITTSITTPSTTFALVNATATTVNAFGAATTIAMGAAGAGTMNVPLTTSASSATTGALTIGNGTAATNVGIGGGNVMAGNHLACGVSGAFYVSPNSAFSTFKMAFGASTFNAPSGFAFLWSSDVSLGSGTKDTSLSRNAAGVLQVGTSSANASGSLLLTNLTASGTLAVTGATTLTGNLACNGTTNTFTLPTTTGSTTTSGIAVAANSLTTGTGIYAASSTLTSGKLMDLQVSGTAAAASQTVLNIATAGANGTSGITTKGAVISNTHTGTSSTNVALELTASGGTTNTALNVTAGEATFAGLMNLPGSVALNTSGSFARSGGSLILGADGGSYSVIIAARTDGNKRVFMATPPTSSGFGYLTVTADSANLCSLTATGTDSNIGFSIVPKGTGLTTLAGTGAAVSGTLAVTGATTLTGNLTSNGAFISTPQALSGNGAVAAVNLTTEVTTIANTGTANTTTTLAAGTNGQKKVISFITDGGFDAVITVTNPAWGGAGTITMNDALDNIELRYLNSVWQVFINNGCTLA